jgi:hypothetical protein
MLAIFDPPKCPKCPSLYRDNKIPGRVLLSTAQKERKNGRVPKMPPARKCPWHGHLGRLGGLGGGQIGKILRG